MGVFSAHSATKTEKSAEGQIWFAIETTRFLREAAVADGEVRRGVPEGLRQRPRDPAGVGRPFPVLQRARPHQALGYRTSAEVFHGEPGVVECECGESDGGGIHRKLEPNHWQERRDSYLTRP